MEDAMDEQGKREEPQNAGQNLQPCPSTSFADNG